MSVVSENRERAGSGAFGMMARMTSPAAGIFLLAILHLVGLAGLYLGWKEWMLTLTPVNLLVSAAIVVGWHGTGRIQLLGLMAIWGTVGFLAEMAGVHTGIPFGNYVYGEVLGPKILEVPIMIGVNWAVLVYASGMIIRPLKAHWLLKASLSAILMVLLDAVLEPIAIRLGFWTWEGGIPPVQNYVGWFLVALPLCAIFHSTHFSKGNKVAVALFFIQFLFFGIQILLG